MINTSNEYKSKIRRNRKFYKKSPFVLSNNTVLNLSDSDFFNDGFRIDDSVGEKIALGSTIINKCTYFLNNFDGKFDIYDFTGAVIRPYSGLQLSETIEYLAKGVFTVDNPGAKGSIIILEALDNMAKFDTEFSNVTIMFPCTNLQLLQAVCLYCGVSLATVSFLNDNYVNSERPVDESISCREVVSWIAQMAGCFARCNVQGVLELKWFDFGVFESEDNLDGGTFDNTTESSYQSGDDADGGDFTFSETTNYDGGTFLDMKRFHHIYSFSGSPTIGTDDIVISGIQVTDNAETPTTVLYGTSGYILPIEGNKLIQNSSQANLIANTVGTKIVGMRFRSFTGNAQSDPSMEAGDVAKISDRKGNSYHVLITSLSYSPGNSELVSCGAETPAKNSYRPTNEMKAVIEARKSIKQALTSYDLAVQQLNGVMANAMGYYPVREGQPDGSFIDYMCDKPTIAESQIIWKKSINGFAVSTDGGTTWTSGMTADGNIIAKTLSVIGINAEWINVVTAFTVGDWFSVNSLGKLICENAEVRGKIIATEGEIAGMNITSQGFLKVTTTDSDTFIGEINLNDGRFNMSFNNNLNTIGCGVNTFYDDDGSPILNLYSRDANGLRNDNILLNGFSVLDMLNSHAAKLAKIENYLADRFDYEI